MKPGRLKEVKGMGWYVGEYNPAQVTVNLNNYTITGIHRLYEEVKKEAAALNAGVAGSEIVGIVPLASLLAAADITNNGPEASPPVPSGSGLREREYRLCGPWKPRRH